MIFEYVCEDDDPVYCHTTQDTITRCGLILTNRRCRIDYSSVLSRRNGQFMNHRASVCHDLTDLNDFVNLQKVELNLPACTTGLNILLRIEKAGILSEHQRGYNGRSYRFARTLKDVVDNPRFHHLLIEVIVVDPSMPPEQEEWSHQNIRFAQKVYQSIKEDLDDLKWCYGEDTNIRHGALVMYNATGYLVRPLVRSEFTGYQRTLWTRRNVFKKRALELFDMFHATGRIQRNIREGPRMNSAAEQPELDISDSDWSECYALASDDNDQRTFIQRKKRMPDRDEYDYDQ
ncbi:unnamed protein product [Zymoseptoria tritici ST99CH_1A5]|uniref:Uncharacterized protein n=1 Tax=Zymoseptoria tritici ST99CH_1A5 TaxID=1276529 RepID=A0A1Y6LSH1_ZYMTR|nr:unnamed protein product [Zymoseptoria tritici ST99CH_1A5]